MSRSRRAFLRALAAAPVAALALSRVPLAAAQEGQPYTVLGFSQGGEPLVVHHLGEARTRVFVMGGQHGGPEANTVRLVRALMATFADDPGQVPEGIGLDFMPIANPDGVATGSRQFLSGVDPNRNWGGADWASDAWDSNAVFRRGLGGPEPFSEPETRMLADWLLRTRPALVVNYHSAGNFMFGAGDVGQAYEDASGYWRPGGGGNTGGGQRSNASPLSYRATGSMNPWLRQVGIQSIFVELATPAVAEVDRNLAGLRAALAVLAQPPAASS